MRHVGLATAGSGAEGSRVPVPWKPLGIPPQALLTPLAPGAVIVIGSPNLKVPSSPQGKAEGTPPPLVFLPGFWTQHHPLPPSSAGLPRLVSKTGRENGKKTGQAGGSWLNCLY